MFYHYDKFLNDKVMTMQHTDASCTSANCEQLHATGHAQPLPSQAQIALAAHMCQALSDPGRMRLLLRLVHGPLCVSELVAYEQAHVSSISARLKVLHTARLVTRRRQAKHIFYALADEHVHGLLRNILSHAAEAA